MSGEPTFEELSAFADGELDDLSVDFQSRFSEDSKAADVLEEISRIDDLVRASFAAEDERPLPDHLVAKVHGAFEQRRIQLEQRAKRASWLPMAAALFIAAAGLAGSYFVAEQRFERRIAAYEENWKAGQKVLETALQDALEHSASGAEVEFAAANIGIKGHVNPTRTYQSRSGHWCREFSEVIEVSGTREFRNGLACRENGGGWQRLETKISGAAPIRLIW